MSVGGGQKPYCHKSREITSVFLSVMCKAKVKQFFEINSCSFVCMDESFYVCHWEVIDL